MVRASGSEAGLEAARVSIFGTRAASPAFVVLLNEDDTIALAISRLTAGAVPAWPERARPLAGCAGNFHKRRSAGTARCVTRNTARTRTNIPAPFGYRSAAHAINAQPRIHAPRCDPGLLESQAYAHT